MSLRPDLPDDEWQEVGCPKCEKFNCLVQVIPKRVRRIVASCGKESNVIRTNSLDDTKTGPLKYECLECGSLFVNDPKYDDHPDHDDFLVRDYEEEDIEV